MRQATPDPRQLTLDPTAGERARAIRARYEVPLRIVDPTDTRFGMIPMPDDGLGDAGRVFDPTDPECGRSRFEPRMA